MSRSTLFSRKVRGAKTVSFQYGSNHCGFVVTKHGVVIYVAWPSTTTYNMASRGRQHCRVDKHPAKRKTKLAISRAASQFARSVARGAK